MGGFLIPAVAYCPAPVTHCPAPVAAHSSVSVIHCPALEDSLKSAPSLQGMTRGREGTLVKKDVTPGTT